MSNFQKISSGIQLFGISTGSRPSVPVNGMIYYDTTLNLFQKYENGSWSAFSGGTVVSGTAGDLALYPSSSTTLSDIYVQNSHNIKLAIASQPTRSTDITYTIPNPGDAVASATLLTNIVQDTAPQLGGNLDVNGFAIQSVSNGSIPIAPNGTGRIRIAKQGALTRYVDVQYIDADTLTASTTAVDSNLTYDGRNIKAQLVKYTIVESTTNARRVGTLYVVSDGASGVVGTTASVIDTSNETADVGVTWSVAFNGNNVELSYTTTANNKTMQSVVERFLA